MFRCNHPEFVCKKTPFNDDKIFCKKCGEIDLIIDNTFIQEYLKNNI